MPLQVNLFSLHGSAGDITDAVISILNSPARPCLNGRRPREDLDVVDQDVEIDMFGRPPLRRLRRDAVGTPGRPIGAGVEPVGRTISTGTYGPRRDAPARPPAPARDRQSSPPAHLAVSPTSDRVLGTL